MEICRSLLFIPASSEKMLNKIDILKPDAFILDLEDSVPAFQKDQARKNIKNKLEKMNSGTKIKLFIRANDLGSEYFYKDIEETIDPKIAGYMIPKFENFNKLNEAISLISKKEKEKNMESGRVKLILMIENPRGIIELNNLGRYNHLLQRLTALTIGWEDFTKDITDFDEVAPELLDFIRMTLMLYAKANKLLTIDTVYRNFTDDEGLKREVIKVSKLGFNGKLAIHPRQIDIINSCFMPSDEEIKKMEIILLNKDRLEKEGAINIDGVMYDPPHLKWALKIKEYLTKINERA
ncbi:MAG: CoA ester lyase [Actinobacteria bacterium]|nr:CoA ester lyase [Actinomycetota bacterium]